MRVQISKRRLYQVGSIVCLSVGLYNLVGGVIVTLQTNTDMNQHVKMIISGFVLVALGIYFSYKSTQPDQQIVLCSGQQLQN